MLAGSGERQSSPLNMVSRMISRVGFLGLPVYSDEGDSSPGTE